MTQLLWNCFLQWHTSAGNRSPLLHPRTVSLWPHGHKTLSCKFDSGQVDYVASPSANSSKPNALSRGLWLTLLIFKESFCYSVLYISSFVGMHKVRFVFCNSLHKYCFSKIFCTYPELHQIFWSIREQSMPNYGPGMRHAWAVTKPPFQDWTRSWGHTQSHSFRHVEKFYILSNSES